MTEHSFRLSGTRPIRTCSLNYDNYRNYKVHLQDDFNRRCGYCNAHDGFFGSIKGYHIDHFAPKSKFPEKQSEYSNLVYSCPRCNWSKGNDWPSESADINVVDGTGYIDPCSAEYNELFARDEHGNVVPKDHEVAEYMYEKLNLYLKRHAVEWQLHRIMKSLQRLQEIDVSNQPSNIRKKIEKLKAELGGYLAQYLELTLNV